MSDGIKKVVDMVRSHTKRAKQTRVNRTLSLVEPQYTEFQRYCRDHGLTASEVVDGLIEVFLAEARRAEVDEAS